MEALAARLSQLDPEAGGVVRVVVFYDTLMRRRVDLPGLVRASAGLAGCVVGLRLHSTGRVLRFTSDGATAPTPEQSPSSATPVLLDEEDIGSVWLERCGPPLALDEALLDRLALAVAAAVERFGPARTTMADPALVELAIAPHNDDATRARALRLLGFAPDQPLRVAAVRASQPLDRVCNLLSPGNSGRSAVIAGTGVVLTTAFNPSQAPSGTRVGLGGIARPDLSWEQARTALRFTTPTRQIVDYATLGASALLALVPKSALRDHADVAAVARIADTPDALATLDAYCTTASVRRAADLLHLHHTSVARRLTQLAKAMGIDPTTPPGLARVNIALTAWRLLED